MATSIGMFGAYTVDATGAFSAATASTAPHSRTGVGTVRTTRELQLVIEGGTMMERFVGPDGTRIGIVFERAR